MTPAYDSDHLETALRRFRTFFQELRASFFEREELLVQIALALLGRQHVLMTGPPGTAKSKLASIVLGRIIDESTSQPSLFARQFTENTVQTDLVGPLNFKTLMESGRTEHFTDEGMLGSVHAFLDEVFDGRDMLLRSTLNLLHEREIKQGAVVTKGRIECAFMTSNRYIAEVLDEARETLLAFVDRIAFISFVPRGFSDPKTLRSVVRRHGGGFGQHTPTAFLSVQDLDVLQAAVDMTYVPEQLCDAVADLIMRLDRELAEAQRYDPKFQPTRYFSTRTAVQAANVLRSIVVYDRIFHHPERPLQATADDVAGLRYFLLLNGVPRQTLADRAASETDPRERRQLDIMATEAEIFDRCIAKLPKVPVKIEPRRLEIEHLETLAAQARRSGDPDALEEAVKTLLSATESGAQDAAKAAHLLVDTVGALSGQALRGGLAPDLTGDDALARLGQELTELAGALERTPGRGRHLADWLRRRLAALVDERLRLSTCPSEGTVATLVADPSLDDLTEQIDARLGELEGIHRLRQQLRAGPAPQDEVWAEALRKLEDELTLLWDARFRVSAVELLAQASRAPLDEVLRSLSPVLAQLETDGHRLAHLGHDTTLTRRVTAPRIEPLVARAFTKLDGRDRLAVIAQVEAVTAELSSAGLDDVISPQRFVTWTVPALARDEVTSGNVTVTDRQAYDAARELEANLSITDTLLRVALAANVPDADAPEANAEAVRETLRGLDDGVRSRVVELDLARGERAIVQLESWWRSLTEIEDHDGAVPRDVRVLEAVVRSGFLRAIRGDSERLRLAAELEHLAEVFPESRERGASLRRRLTDLDTHSTKVLVDLLERKADAQWAQALD